MSHSQVVPHSRPARPRPTLPFTHDNNDNADFSTRRLGPELHLRLTFVHTSVSLGLSRVTHHPIGESMIMNAYEQTRAHKDQMVQYAVIHL